MEYNIVVSESAQNEIEEAIEYYFIRNQNSSIEFYYEIQKIYRLLAVGPYYEVKYKNIRSIPLIKFPYSIFFTANIENLSVKILSCFHNSQNPQKRPN